MGSIRIASRFMVFMTVLSMVAIAGSVAFAEETPVVTAGSPAPGTTLEELDQKVRVLERKWEIEQENAAAKAKETPYVTAGKDGFSIRSADGSYQLKLNGYIQVDGRFYFGDDSPPLTNTFLLRRVRPNFEGTVARYFSFRILLDFGEGKTSVQDAYVDFTYFPQAKLRAGKFKSPVGLERLQSVT